MFSKLFDRVMASVRETERAEAETERAETERRVRTHTLTITAMLSPDEHMTLNSILCAHAPLILGTAVMLNGDPPYPTLTVRSNDRVMGFGVEETPMGLRITPLG